MFNFPCQVCKVPNQIKERIIGQRPQAGPATFIRWVLGFLPSSNESQVVATKKHLHMSDTTFKEFWQEQHIGEVPVSKQSKPNGCKYIPKLLKKKQYGILV